MNESELQPSSRETLASLLLPPAVIAAIAVAAGHVHYLLFHTLAEVFSIIIAMTALVVASTSSRFTRNHFTVFVAVAIGWCAALDLAHTVSYKGMHLLAGDDANLPTQLWIAARAIQAGALVVSPLFFHRGISLASAHIALGGAALGAAAWIFSGAFPDAFIDGVGLTPFKIYAEYAVILLLLISSGRFWQRRSLMSERLFTNMQWAMAAMVVSEFAFTRYASVYGDANQVGHIAKIFAYWFVYRALVQSTLSEPFSMLSRTASSYDAVPDPVVVVGSGGRILQVNAAASRFAGLAPQALIGRALHDLFHASDTSVEQCPVCSRIARGEAPFMLEVDRGADRGIGECSVASVLLEGRETAFVHAMRDVTERKRMAIERERLVSTLGKRVQELGCLYAISSLIGRADLDARELLGGVVALLPSAFARPGSAVAWIESNWGAFGQASRDAERRNIVRPLIASGVRVGTMTVGYDELLSRGPSEPFLAEEQALMDTVAQKVGEALARIQAQAQVKRLTYLYNMLSATNRAIVHCKSQDTLLRAVFDALVLHSAFPMLLLAQTDDGRMPFRATQTHGIKAQWLAALAQALSSPDGELAQAFPELAKGRLVRLGFNETTATAADPWKAHLRELGIVERIVLPLMREGQLIGILAMYPDGSIPIDAAQMALLNEMYEDLSFSLGSLAAVERRQMAELRANASELRFKEVFDASPTPMLIESLVDQSMHSMNQALEQWLGYGPQDIQSEADWFERVYADPILRDQMARDWPLQIASVRASGETLRSPELRLRAKDGSERIARGTMRVVGDDIVIAWTDLTQIRHSEQALRDSEAHFRAMIEQTVTGIYVRRAQCLVYINPSYCEMLGYARDELLGRDVWELTHPDPENVRRVQAGWAELEAGARSVHYNASLVCKNGQIREFALHASRIDWDGAPATIVMAEDITQRIRSEQQIANYIVQLKASMRGSLQAVSNMIDLRDPYTAGHERRVGLIAGAIASEMGWPKDQCEELELIGLVHDIGKIAIPAEILSKPGRLNAMEMEMVRGHAEAGYDILKDVPFSFPVAEVIRQHHERLDGSGYPRGLRGEQILPQARILAVADVLESMAAHRPYRPALGVDVALAELESGRGRLYDPAVLDALLRLLRERGYQLPS